MTPTCGYRLLPHTADMGIEAWADSPEELFMAAAQGLREMLFGSTPIATEEQWDVTLEATEEAELLVSWLNEILYVLEVKDLAPAAFDITALHNGRLQAVIHGAHYNPDIHPLQRQVKAVTYHQLTLQQRPEDWYARVYVDL